MTKTSAGIYVFGEVLFDIFPAGERLLGGAPFNVAWHLQALGDEPLFISRTGQDREGEEIRQAMQDWGMDLAAVQEDDSHPSGRVLVSFEKGEPSYQIVPDCAYDFIESPALPGERGDKKILYHGTLALRNLESQRSLEGLKAQCGVASFVDVNLRSPWWQKEQVPVWLETASWVKLNEEELHLLGSGGKTLEAVGHDFLQTFNLEQLIVTRGRAGAMVLTSSGQTYRLAPPEGTLVVDTVGAGDAFTAVYLHGLLRNWPIERTLDAAQAFAGKVVGIRGAISRDRCFYKDFIDALSF